MILCRAKNFNLEGCTLHTSPCLCLCLEGCLQNLFDDLAVKGLEV